MTHLRQAVRVALRRRCAQEPRGDQGHGAAAVRRQTRRRAGPGGPVLLLLKKVAPLGPKAVVLERAAPRQHGSTSQPSSPTVPPAPTAARPSRQQEHRRLTSPRNMHSPCSKYVLCSERVGPNHPGFLRIRGCNARRGRHARLTDLTRTRGDLGPSCWTTVHICRMDHGERTADEERCHVVVRPRRSRRPATLLQRDTPRWLARLGSGAFGMVRAANMDYRPAGWP